MSVKTEGGSIATAPAQSAWRSLGTRRLARARKMFTKPKIRRPAPMSRASDAVVWKRTPGFAARARETMPSWATSNPQERQATPKRTWAN